MLAPTKLFQDLVHSGLEIFFFDAGNRNEKKRKRKEKKSDILRVACPVASQFFFFFLRVIQLPARVRIKCLRVFSSVTAVFILNTDRFVRLGVEFGNFCLKAALPFHTPPFFVP